MRAYFCDYNYSLKELTIEYYSQMALSNVADFQNPFIINHVAQGGLVPATSTPLANKEALYNSNYQTFDNGILMMPIIVRFDFHYLSKDNNKDFLPKLDF